MSVMSAKEMAAEIGCDPKTFRRFVRAITTANDGVIGVDTPGSGRRYAFDSSHVDEWRASFDEWRTTRGSVIMRPPVAIASDDDDVVTSDDDASEDADES